jgi:hypothetical protein
MLKEEEKIFESRSNKTLRASGEANEQREEIKIDS